MTYDECKIVELRENRKFSNPKTKLMGYFIILGQPKNEINEKLLNNFGSTSKQKPLKKIS